MSTAVPLEGLYLHLLRVGFRLSARDYQDALTALRRGHGLHTREELRWLCETLWARGDEEMSRLARLFRDLPRPTADDVRALTQQGPGAQLGAGRAARHRHRGKTSVASPPTDAESGAPSPTIEFVAPTESGIGLPRAHVPHTSDQTFILTPRPLVALRSLVIAWRRFRIAQRSGPRTELDIDATIAAQCRRGTLVEPALVPARRNQARLVLLIDVSPSMITWADTSRLVVESLERSQLARTGVYFFDDVPEDVLHESDALTRPVRLQTVLERHARSAVVVLSDAGAVRGHVNRERVAATRRLLEAIKSVWQPLAWLNPMPRRRWAGTTAEHLARSRGLSMFEMNDEGLIHAVDYLRGKRTA